jgi:hypothetical protein
VVTAKPALVIDWQKETGLIDESLQPEKISQIGTLTEVGQCLEDRYVSYSSIFIAADRPGPSAFTVAGEIRRRFPFASLYLIHGEEAPLRGPELGRLGIQGVVSRAGLKKVLGDYLKRFDELEPELKQAQARRVEKRAPNKAEPERLAGFRPVWIEEAVIGRLSCFDVHLCLPGGKKIKIFQANDPLEKSRTLKFLEEGVQWVYVKEASLNRCLENYGLLLSGLLKNKNVSHEVKLLRLSELSSRIWAKGPSLATPASAEFVEEAEELVQGTMDLIKRSSGRGEELLRSYLKHAKLLDHAFCTALVAGLIAKELKLENPKIVGQIGLASFLHDLGLVELPEKFKAESEEEMTSADRVLYESHPEKSVAIMNQLGIWDEAILQAAAQHHERRDKSGFPKRLGAGEIHVYAELIGISDELVRWIKDYGPPTKPRLSRFRDSVFNLFSIKTIEAFQKVFM